MRRRNLRAGHHGTIFGGGFRQRFRTTWWNPASARKSCNRYLASLSQREREILERFYLQEQSAVQIRDEMKLTCTNYRVLKSRAKAKFGKTGRHWLHSPRMRQRCRGKLRYGATDVNATQVLRKMRGASQAHLMRADDGRHYVVKLDTPENRRTLVNEFLAGFFLEHLGFNTPRTAVVQLDGGKHFGSGFPGDPEKTVVYDFIPDPAASQRGESWRVRRIAGLR